MEKQYTGPCPVQDKDYSISITYINASTYNQVCYEKGTFECKYNLFGDNCTLSKCPIYEAAPEEIH